MKENKKSNHDSCPITQGKDTNFINQYRIVYLSFRERPKTMLEVSKETGILRANICRYVAKMEDNRQIQLIQKGLCPISKDRAGFYSTNENLFIKLDISQLNLFDDDEL